MSLPAHFVQTMQSQLGMEWPYFVAALETLSPTSIHYNLAKTSDQQLFKGETIPWNKTGQYLPERPSFTLDPHFHAGRYYVQEAGSMFLAFLLKQLQLQHNIKVALDLCAAPGGKTTLLLNHLPADSLIVANEVIKSRYRILQENLAKWGRSNVISTQGDSQQFADLAGQFDLVLVDAPCSGEGLFRKNPKAMGEWSPDNVQLCESRQRRILANAMPLVQEGGFLIYSTCTYNAKENDGNVDWMIKQGGFSIHQVDYPSDWGITSTKNGYQFYPHRTQSEGFYISVLQKISKEKTIRKVPPMRYFSLAGKSEKEVVSNWVKGIENFILLQNPNGDLFILPGKQQEILTRLSPRFSRITPGTPLGTIKGKDLVPDHAWALSIHQNTQIKRIDLALEPALAFLRKQNFSLPDAIQSVGWHLVSYQNYGIGWVKVLPKRINNYLPNQLRIRKN